MFLRLELFVDDIARSIAFYKSVLGFEIDREEPGYASIRNGDAILGIGLAAHLPPGHHFSPEIRTARRGIGTEIVLEVGDVQASFEQARRSGATILTKLGTRSWGATDYRIADPDGYYLRITSRTSNP